MACVHNLSQLATLKRRQFNGFSNMASTGLYKVRLTSIADVLKRSQNLLVERNEKRKEFFWGSRVLPEQPAPAPAPVEKKKLSRAEMLKKWKEEKMKKLEEEKKKQKPVFKVGIVQRKATGSPLMIQTKANPKTTTQQIIKKPQAHDSQIKSMRVLTRARAKDLNIKVTEVKSGARLIERGLNNKFCKVEAGEKKKIDSRIFVVPESVSKLSCSGVTLPSTPTFLKKKAKKKKLQVGISEKKALQQNVKASNVQDEEHIVNVELTNNEKAKEVMEQINVRRPNIRSPEEKVKMKCIQEKVVSQPQIMSPPRKEIEDDDYRPIVFSPFVTVRIGKKSQRKSKKSLSMDLEKQIKKEESEFKCRIFSFRKYIECEKKRLLNMCDKWKRIYEEFQEVPADVEGDIDSLIGKTNLLTSDKFMQFQSLIDKCERGDPLIKVDDLQGFQDWVSLEVERVDEEFCKLEKRKNDNWKSETVSVKVSKTQKVKANKNSRKPMGSSNIRSHILAARKLLKEGNANGGQESQLPVLALELAIKTTTPKKKDRLLKGVLNSETKKINSAVKESSFIREKRNSGLEIMIATQKNKLPTPVKLRESPLLTDYEIFIGGEETPSKSILKKTPKATSSSKSRVTFKKVTENLVSGGRGLDERYFQPLMDDDFIPVRTVLSDLGNLTPGGIQTRSRTKKISCSTLISPQNN